LPELSLADDGRLLVAARLSLPFSHRHFSHLMALHPLGLIDVRDGPPAERTVAASLAELDRLGTDWWCGYSFAWRASLAARARDGAAAERNLERFATAFTLRNSFHANGDQSGRGYSKFTYRPFTLEGNFAAAAGLQEMLLQSHRGRIEIFPAVPLAWHRAAFTQLRAQGAFLVSASLEDGRVARAEIVSERGGPCRLLSPFTGRDEVHPTRAGQRLVFTPSASPR
jgi:alpha-L-fucosidase 2